MKWFTNWFRGVRPSFGRGEQHRPTDSRRQASGKRSIQQLRVEHLEDRTVPTTGWAANVPGATSWGVALDPNNADVYVAGPTIAKYTADGSLLWSQSLAGQSPGAYSIAVDPAGAAAYATGPFTGTLVHGSQTLTSAGGSDAYVAKFDSSGNILWAKSFGALGTDAGRGIAVDATGVYVSGVFSNTVAFDDHTLTSAGNDAFVLKLDPSGNVVYATQSVGTGGTAGAFNKLAVDGSGQAYVPGLFEGTVSFGASSITSAGSRDAFIAKVDANGDFVWARPMGGPNYDIARGVAVDGNGHVFVSGTFYGTSSFGNSLQDGSGATSLTSLGTGDAFVADLDAASGNFLWAKQIGGTGDTYGNSLALDVAGNVYLAGAMWSAVAIDCDPGPGTAILSLYNTNQTGNGFVTKLSPAGNFLGAWQMGSGITNGVAVGSDGSIYTCGGMYSNPAKFDTGAQYVNLSTAGGTGFVSRMTVDKATIFGLAFNDLNKNGVQDTGEAPFAGVTVYLDTNNNGVRNNGEPTTTTNAQGGFSFYHLAPGTYTVREVAPSGYTVTSATAFTVTLAAGQANDSASFGNGRTPRTTTYANNTVISTTASSPNAISTLTIAESYLVQTLSITLKVSNTALKPLTIKLFAPDGTVVILAANVKANGTVTYSTSALNGKNVNGLWTLEVYGLAGGKLNNWSLSIFG